MKKNNKNEPTQTFDIAFLDKLEYEQPSDKKNINKMKKDQKQRGSTKSLFGLFASKKKDKHAGYVRISDPTAVLPPVGDVKGLDINKTTLTIESACKQEANSFEYDVLEPVEERKTE